MHKHYRNSLRESYYASVYDQYMLPKTFNYVASFCSQTVLNICIKYII